MKRIIIATVSVGVLLAGCGSTGGGSTPVETKPVGGTSADADGSSAAPAESGDWKFSKVVSKTAYGTTTATMRATNTTGDSRSAFFTVTYFNKAGDILGTASGAANDVPANKTVTVQLISTDNVNLKQVAKTEIQTDGSF